MTDAPDFSTGREPEGKVRRPDRLGAVHPVDP